MYELNMYEGRLRYADRTPKNGLFEEKKSGQKNIFVQSFFSIIRKKHRPKKNIILKMAEKSAQTGGYNPQKRVTNPSYIPPEKRF